MEETVPLLTLQKPNIISSSKENACDESHLETVLISQLLNSLLIRIEDHHTSTNSSPSCKSESLSHLVYSHMGSKGNDDGWIIHVYVPSRFLVSDLCSEIKIKLKQNGKFKSTLLDLREGLFSMEDHNSCVGFRRYSGVYPKVYRTGSISCWVVATLRNFEKQKFTINTFEKSAPSRLKNPSCWNVFFTISRIIHENIKQTGRGEKFELVKLLNFWATIIAVQNEESKKNVKNFLLIDSDIPKSIANMEDLRTSPLFLLMFVVFNCDRIPECHQLQKISDKFDSFLEEIDQNKVGKGEKSIKYLMRRIFDIGIIYLKDIDGKKQFITSELGGEMSKLYSLMSNFNPENDFLSMYFEICTLLTQSNSIQVQSC